MLWIFSIAFQHGGKRGAQSAGIPADGGRATPPCGSLGACPADADNEAAIAVTQHGTSSILKKRFNCPSIRNMYCGHALPLMEIIRREIGESAFRMTIRDFEASTYAPITTGWGQNVRQIIY